MSFLLILGLFSQEMFHKMREERYKWRADVSLNGLHGEIAALMEEMFEGAAGERLREATSTFCKNQQHALDILRSRSVIAIRSGITT